MFPGFIPLALPGEMNEAELAKAEEIRAKQLKYIGTATVQQIAGLTTPSEQDQKDAQEIEEAQIELHNSIWERFDPGATLRRADAERQFNEFVAKMQSGEAFSGKGSPFGEEFENDTDYGDDDDSEVEHTYVEHTLKQKVDGIIKKLFKRD